MLYSILIYGSEDRVGAWTPDEEREVMGRHANLRQEMTEKGRLGPVLRLTPKAGKTVRRYKERKHITDGPFAETKEQLMGLYVVECETFEAAVEAAERLTFDTAVFEITPVSWLDPGVLPAKIPPPQK